MPELAIERIGEAIDRMLTVDMASRGFIQTLYDAARSTLNNQPLALTAAVRLAQATTPGQPVLIATGIPVRGWFSPAIAETDGPVGAATLARAVYLSLRALPILLCEEPQVPVLRACVRAAGLTPTSFEQIATAKASPDAIPHRSVPVAVVQGFAADPQGAMRETKRLLERKPSGLISIERQGANAKGVYHYSSGEANKREIMAKIETLFEEARSRDILTIGIGDAGNELGMGRIKEAVRRHVPFGAKCACPCQSGIAPEFSPDVLIVATVSNWGAYGIAACLAAMTEDLRVLHSAQTELDVIRACTGAGGVDGFTAFADPLVDALPAKISAYVVEILHAIVANGLNPPAFIGH